MSYAMVTQRHNRDDGYIALVDIVLQELPETIHVGALALTKKSEFHVSLMALKHLMPLLGVSEDELVHDFLEFQKDHPLIDFALTSEFRLVRRHERASVIVMVDMPEIEKLFVFLRAKYRRDIPTQPTHITLYTLQPETGIGIFSNEALQRDSQRIDVPELDRLW
ncbi:MAG: hypothetical protein WAU02_03145 [Candidatus Saccharimonadales bacterium]